MAIQWDQSYSVGINTFDQHHQNILKLLNTLEESAKTEGTSSAQVIDALKELLDYSVYHFNAEERELQAYNYPNLQQQKNEHKKFTAKIENFSAMYLAGSEPNVSDVIDFLRKWILTHIHEVDKNYGSFLQEKGSR